jgi:hypothetical protein
MGLRHRPNSEEVAEAEWINNVESRLAHLQLRQARQTEASNLRRPALPLIRSIRRY